MWAVLHSLGTKYSFPLTVAEQTVEDRCQSQDIWLCVGHQLLISQGPHACLALVVAWQVIPEVLLSCDMTLACLLPCEMMLPPGEDFVQFCLATEAVVASTH